MLKPGQITKIGDKNYPPWEWGVRQGGFMNVEVMTKNLWDLKEALDKYNIKFVLIFGTLLGAIRENRLLPYDKDADIACFSGTDHRKMYLAVKDLTSKGFFVLDKNMCPLHDHFVVRKGEKIDIWWFDKINKDWVYDNNVRYPQIYFDQAYDIGFLNRKFKVPFDPKKFLKITYGNSWVTPNPKGSYILNQKTKKEVVIENPNVKVPVKILIGIATYRRLQKLIRLLNSIEKQTYKDYQIVIVFDNNDKETWSYIKEKYPNIICILNEKQEFVIGCWNKIHKEFLDFDAHLTLCDDVVLYENCIEEAVKELETKFPNKDGVIGITQQYPNHPNVFFQPTGQVLIGKKFLERYKNVNYQVCCPNYKQWYQDEELLLYTTFLNKFSLAKKAMLTHFHPGYYKEEMDETHNIIRGEIQKKDKEIYNKRRENNLIWGQNWTLI